MKFQLVINPKSGKGKALDYGQRAADVLKQRGHHVETFSGESAESTNQFLKSLPELDGLLVCGGDGLVHMAIQHLAGTDTPLGIIPAGTGNDAARSLGLPLHNPEAAIEVILSSRPVKVDLGRTLSGEGVRWFLQILSTGFDSEVNERANNYTWPSGTWKYNRAMLALLPRFKAISYTMNIDGQTRNFQAMLVAVANGPSYGGGMLVCPDASFRDGELDIMILQPLGKLRFLSLFPRVYRGTHVFHPRVTTLRARSLHLEGRASTYADGERVAPLPLSVEVVSGALQVWGTRIP